MKLGLFQELKKKNNEKYNFSKHLSLIFQKTTFEVSLKMKDISSIDYNW